MSSFSHPYDVPDAHRSDAEPATLGPRLGALAIDTAIVMAFGAACLLAGSPLMAVTDSPVLLFGGTLALFTVGTAGVVLYAPLMVAFCSGQTVGKRAVGIRVVRTDRRPVGFWCALWREAGAKYALWGTAVLFIADVGWAVHHANGTSVHDLLAGTRVVGVRGR